MTHGMHFEATTQERNQNIPAQKAVGASDEHALHG
jgi:hypothetical protein